MQIEFDDTKSCNPNRSIFISFLPLYSIYNSHRYIIAAHCNRSQLCYPVAAAFHERSTYFSSNFGNNAGLLCNMHRRWVRGTSRGHRHHGILFSFLARDVVALLMKWFHQLVGVNRYEMFSHHFCTRNSMNKFLVEFNYLFRKSCDIKYFHSHAAAHRQR